MNINQYTWPLKGLFQCHEAIPTGYHNKADLRMKVDSWSSEDIVNDDYSIQHVNYILINT